MTKPTYANATRCSVCGNWELLSDYPDLVWCTQGCGKRVKHTARCSKDRQRLHDLKKIKRY